jgi:hypothetical protein
MKLLERLLLSALVVLLLYLLKLNLIKMEYTMKSLLLTILLTITSFNSFAKNNNLPAYLFSHSNIVTICSDLTKETTSEDKVVVESLCLKNFFFFGVFQDGQFRIHKEDLNVICAIINEKYNNFNNNESPKKHLIEYHCLNIILKKHIVFNSISFTRPSF